MTLMWPALGQIYKMKLHNFDTNYFNYISIFRVIHGMISKNIIPIPIPIPMPIPIPIHIPITVPTIQRYDCLKTISLMKLNFMKIYLNFFQEDKFMNVVLNVFLSIEITFNVVLIREILSQ